MTFNDYPKMSVATDVVIFAVDDIKTEDKRKVPEKGLQVFMIKRDIEPFKDSIQLPGGFVDIDKDIYEAAKDKLFLKTGIKNLYMEQLYTYGSPDRDERGRVVSVAHMAIVQKKNIDNKNGTWSWVIPTRDKNNQVQDISLLDNNLNEISNIAFDHKSIIIDAFNRIKNKIEYTDIAFNFLSKYFTVKELEMVYKCILGREVQAFRRKIGDKIKPSGIMQDNGAAYRPAEYYQYNKNHSQKL